MSANDHLGAVEKDLDSGLSMKITQFYDVDYCSPTFGAKQGCAIEVQGEPPIFSTGVSKWNRENYGKTKDQ